MSKYKTNESFNLFLASIKAWVDYTLHTLIDDLTTSQDTQNVIVTGIVDTHWRKANIINFRIIFCKNLDDNNGML